MDSRERYKGHDRVIATIPNSFQGATTFGCLVVGNGDGRSRLEALAREAGLSERVRFLGTAEAQSFVETYRCADLFRLWVSMWRKPGTLLTASWGQ